MQDSIELPPNVVTPEGVRDGDPAALSGLTARRGSAVLAYAERVAAPDEAIAAAAEAFAWFRRAVVEASDPYSVDPERTLLRGARYTAASHAPRAMALRARLRGGASPCELVPELLAARAERELGDADVARLTRHLERCDQCREAEERFRIGERAYRDAPDVPPPPAASRAIMRALLGAAPNAHAGTPAGAGADAGAIAGPGEARADAETGATVDVGDAADARADAETLDAGADTDAVAGTHTPEATEAAAAEVPIPPATPPAVSPPPDEDPDDEPI